MKRRTLLKLGLGASVALGLAGLAAAQWRSPLSQGKLSADARLIFWGIGNAILDGSLPAEASARAAALDGMVQRIEILITGLPGATQDELAELLSILSLTPGRIAVFGLLTGWRETPVERMQGHLQTLRLSSLALRQQVYHAFHEIVNGAYFADEQTWALMGYSGPIKL